MAFLLYWRWLQLDLSRVARSDVPLGNLFFYGASPVLILHIIKHFGQVFLKYDFSLPICGTSQSQHFELRSIQMNQTSNVRICNIV